MRSSRGLDKVRDIRPAKRISTADTATKIAAGKALRDKFRGRSMVDGKKAGSAESD
jgi:hypothetical protein